MTADHLGSTRVVTGQNQAVVARYDYLPFGEEMGAGVGSRTLQMGYGGADSTKQKFTSKERDSESGLDYFLARYYSSAQGRFTSVDPAGGNRSDAQSWNGYAYSRNNPLKYIDPDGTTYRLYDLDGNSQDISDANADEWRKQDGVVFKKGKIFDKDGKQLGTYQRTWFDNESESFNRFVFGMAARAPAMNQAIAGFAVVTYGTGAAIGAGVFYAPVVVEGIRRGVDKASEAAKKTEATTHGAQRLAERGFSPSDVALTKTGTIRTQADGATVFIKEVAPGKFNVIVEGERGVITALKNISQKAVDKLAQNYGWK